MKGTNLMINRNRVTLIGLLIGSLTAFAGADWPNFRGPNHDGISHVKGIQTKWDKAIPMVWDREIGSAFSSFAVVGDRLYTCGTVDERQTLFCLNAKTGEVIWQNKFEEAYNDSHGSGTRSTPTVDGDRVYIQGAHGRLLCVDAATGEKVWDTTFDHKPQWGYSGSVLIEGEMAIACGGKNQGALVAMNKKTGKVIWTCGDDAPGYATPYPFDFAGKRYIVGFTGQSFIIAEAKTGKLAFRRAWKTDWDVNAAAPIFHDGHLFVSSGYKTGCGVFKLSPSGDGLAAQEVWKSKVFMNKFQSCILYKGDLYASDQNALTCAAFLTGEQKWRVERIKHGTIVINEGHLFLLTQEGELQIAPATPSGYEPTAKAEILTGRCWTVSVLHDGRIYARSLERVVCFDLTGEG